MTFFYAAAKGPATRGLVKLKTTAYSLMTVSCTVNGLMTIIESKCCLVGGEGRSMLAGLRLQWPPCPPEPSGEATRDAVRTFRIRREETGKRRKTRQRPFSCVCERCLCNRLPLPVFMQVDVSPCTAWSLLPSNRTGGAQKRTPVPDFDEAPVVRGIHKGC